MPDDISTASPEGIDVYFDNVGGEHLQAAIAVLRDHGRVALCGAISQYNATAPTPAPNNLAMAISKRLTLRGFLVFDHAELSTEYAELAAEWLADGSLVSRRTVVEGIDNAPRPFLICSAGPTRGRCSCD